MPISITVSDMVTRATQRAYVDVTGTGGPITETEATGLVNTHYRRLYQKLARKAPWRFASDTTITTSSGTIGYALPSDYLFTLAVWANESTDERRRLANVNDFNRQMYKAPQGTYTVTHRYVPTPSSLTTSANTIDGVCGIDEWVVVHVARDIRIKTQRAIDDLTFEIQELTQEIYDIACSRDLGMPEEAGDFESVGLRRYTQQVDGYQIYGTTMSLFTTGMVWP
jgi:hypothetical protein